MCKEEILQSLKFFPRCAWASSNIFRHIFQTFSALLPLVSPDFVATVNLVEFCDQDGLLYNGQTCDKDQIFGKECDLEFQFCMDNSYQ